MCSSSKPSAVCVVSGSSTHFSTWRSGFKSPFLVRDRYFFSNTQEMTTNYSDQDEIILQMYSFYFLCSLLSIISENPLINLNSFGIVTYF